MNKVDIHISYEKIHISELSESEKKLHDKAHEAAKIAYAPFSNFYVGAACLLSNGEIFSASNQENVAYPSGLCAERSLLYYIGANFPHEKVEKLFVVIQSPKKNIHNTYSPCGACRQAMAQTESRQNEPMQVYFEYGDDYFLKANKMEDLLPFIFNF